MRNAIVNFIASNLESVITESPEMFVVGMLGVVIAGWVVKENI